MDYSDHRPKKGVSKAFLQLWPPRPGHVASAQHGECAQGPSGGGLWNHCLGSSPTSATAVHCAVNKPLHLEP